MKVSTPNAGAQWKSGLEMGALDTGRICDCHIVKLTIYNLRLLAYLGGMAGIDLVRP